MYNIYYSLVSTEWEGVDFETNANTPVKAFMCAVREIRTVLSTMEVQFLPVDEMEFVIWAFGKCKGFLAITEIGPETSVQDL